MSEYLNRKVHNKQSIILVPPAEAVKGLASTVVRSFIETYKSRDNADPLITDNDFFFWCCLAGVDEKIIIHSINRIHRKRRLRNEKNKKAE